MIKPKEEQTKKEYTSLDNAIHKVLTIHPVPCVILLRVNKDYEFSLEAVASNNETMGLITSENKEEKPDYYG